MIHTDGITTIAHRAADDVFASKPAASPHERTRDLLVSLVEDELGSEANVVLSRVDSLSFTFTDERGERWDVHVNRH